MALVQANWRLAARLTTRGRYGHRYRYQATRAERGAITSATLPSIPRTMSWASCPRGSATPSPARRAPLPAGVRGVPPRRRGYTARSSRWHCSGGTGIPHRRSHSVAEWRALTARRAARATSEMVTGGRWPSRYEHSGPPKVSAARSAGGRPVCAIPTVSAGSRGSPPCEMHIGCSAPAPLLRIHVREDNRAGHFRRPSRRVGR